MKLSTNFTLEEMTYSDTAVRKSIDNTPSPEQQKNIENLCLNVLEEIQDLTGLTIKVTSGFRCVRLNKLIGGSSTSQHCDGQAADIHALGMSTEELFQKIKNSKIPYDQLIQEFSQWVHVSYSDKNRRQALRATKVKGKTVYATA